MEGAVKDIFAAVGMEFIGRNYAMGATSAVMEVALCSDQIFGLDVDVISWDFGMTDGSKHPWKQDLFHQRTVESNPNRPFGVCLKCGGRGGASRAKVARDLEDLGLAVSMQDDGIWKNITDSIPDSFGKTDQELEAMPPFIRNMQCGDLIENGDPYCGIQKFNHTDCIKRKRQTSWHPGWKSQAVMGNSMALFLVELLEDALKELAAYPTKDLMALLKALQASEDADYEKYLTSPIDPNLYDITIGEGKHEGFDFTLLTKGDMFCHTARLPAEIRHKGILTESIKTGSFDIGTPFNVALEAPNASSSMMRLVYDPNEQTDWCLIVVLMDFKYFFMVSGAEGWQSLTLPNNAELKEYGKGQEKVYLQVYVAICFRVCEGKCPENTLQPVPFLEGKFELTVNGKSVERLSNFADCKVLHSQESGYTWQPNADGQFEVAARVAGNSTLEDYVGFSAIIVW